LIQEWNIHGQLVGYATSAVQLGFILGTLLFALATAVNGRIFQDQAGKFTAIRNTLVNDYPDDVRIKKIAARCMSAGQAGQYNYPRCVK